MEKIRKLINAIKQNDMTDKTEIVLSSVIFRDDQDLEDEINDRNKKMRIYVKGKVCILQITVI